MVVPDWIRGDRGRRFFIGAAILFAPLLMRPPSIMALYPSPLPTLFAVASAIACGIWADAKHQHYLWGFTGYLWAPLGLMTVLLTLPDRSRSGRGVPLLASEPPAPGLAPSEPMSPTGQTGLPGPTSPTSPTSPMAVPEQVPELGNSLAEVLDTPLRRSHGRRFLRVYAGLCAIPAALVVLFAVSWVLGHIPVIRWVNMGIAPLMLVAVFLFLPPAYLSMFVAPGLFEGGIGVAPAGIGGWLFTAAFYAVFFAALALLIVFVPGRTRR